MMRPRFVPALCGLFALCCVFARGASAASFTLNGQLANDTAVAQYQFSVSGAETDNFYTTSYAGGLNADGTVTRGGGFDPVLSLYTSSGTFLATSGGANSCVGTVGKDSVTGLCNDAFFTQALTSGSYILTVTEFPFYPNGDLSSGFFSSIAPTAIADACGSSTPFLESDVAPCLARTANYTVNVAPLATAATPEPATWMLLAGPLAGLIGAARRRLA